jgi:hypothetical protein
MQKTTRMFTLWMLLTVLALGSAYLIVERANPALRSTAGPVPAGLGH